MIRRWKRRAASADRSSRCSKGSSNVSERSRGRRSQVMPSAHPSKALIAAAPPPRPNAQARFSGFKVGAALETADGTIITGCNIENATYGLTICAERVAMFKALSDGHTKFRRVSVVADTDEPT